MYKSRYWNLDRVTDGEDWKATNFVKAVELLEGMSHPMLVEVAQRVGLTFLNQSLYAVHEEDLHMALLNDYSERQLLPVIEVVVNEMSIARGFGVDLPPLGEPPELPRDIELDP